MTVAVVGSLSLDRVGGGTPRIGGCPFYAAQALRALDVKAVVLAKCARRRPAGLAAAARPARYPGGVARLLRIGGLFLFLQRRPQGDDRGRGGRPVDARRRGGAAEGRPLGARGPAHPQRLPARNPRRARPRAPAVAGRPGPRSTRADRAARVRRRLRPGAASLGLDSQARRRRGGAARRGSGRARAGPPRRSRGRRHARLARRGGLRGRRRRARTRYGRSKSADPTGAGDAFAAGYLVARSRGAAPTAAARLASALVAGLLSGRAA